MVKSCSCELALKMLSAYLFFGLLNGGVTSANIVLHNSKACSETKENMRQGFTKYSLEFWTPRCNGPCESICKSQQYQTVLTYFMTGKTHSIKFCPFIEPMASGLWPLPLILIVCILAHVKTNRCVIVSTLSFVSFFTDKILPWSSKIMILEHSNSLGYNLRFDKRRNNINKNLVRWRTRGQI